MQNLITEIKSHTQPTRLFTKNHNLFDTLKVKYAWCETALEMIYCINNNILEAPICQLSTCMNVISFAQANRKYNVGCCKSHSQMVARFKKGGMESLKMTDASKIKKKQTFMDNYGVDNPMKDNICKEKQHTTMFANHGVKSPLQSKKIKEKTQQTCIDRYGVDNVMKYKEIQQRVINTNNSKFGVSCVFKNPIIQQKRQQTCFLKFGVLYPLQNKDILDKCKKTKLLKYGVEFPFQSTEIQQNIAILNRSISKGELELFNMIDSNNKIQSDRSILDGKEIDIYLPFEKIAIEFNGIYWHSELNGKDKNYHLGKTIQCDEKGIQLLHIFETEWHQKQNIILSVINAKRGQFKDRIYARKTKIREITIKEKNNFLEENHLQGQDKSAVKLGLFYEATLVSVMTFGKSRYNVAYEYEMHRFCNKLGTQIIGGASKLWKYFQRNFQPVSVITYSDRRYSNGLFYEKIGFTKLRETAPNHFYFKGNSGLMSRIAWQKHKLKDKLPIFDETLTAWKNMQLNGYDRIYDCGNYVFEWKL